MNRQESQTSDLDRTQHHAGSHQQSGRVPVNNTSTKFTAPAGIDPSGERGGWVPADEIQLIGRVPKAATPKSSKQSSTDRRPILERILSPDNLQKMMAASGLLLVIGLAVWLWSVGVFQNPITLVASCVTANLGLIALGCLLVLLTRFHLAGTGLTLLGCLTLPLNLWLLHSNHLMSLQNGDPLWIPSAIICFIYGLVGKITKDSKLVYVTACGTILTGCLFLASPLVGGFFSPVHQFLFLLSIGWAFTFATCLFPPGKGGFGRENFGEASFQSGIAIVGLATSGLVGLLVFHATGGSIPWLPTGRFTPSMPLLIGLTCSIAGCLLGDRLVKRHKAFLILGITQATGLVWASTMFFHLSVNAFVITTILSLLMIVTNITLLLKNSARDTQTVLFSTGITTLLQFAAASQFLCLITDTFADVFCGWSAAWNAMGLACTASSAAFCGAVLSKRQKQGAETAITLLGFTGSMTAVFATVCLVSALPFGLDFTLPLIALPTAFAIGVFLHRHNRLAVSGYSAATIGSLLCVSISYVTLPSWSSSLLPLSHPLAWTSWYAALASAIFASATFLASRANDRLSIVSMIYCLFTAFCVLEMAKVGLNIQLILPFTLVGLGWKLIPLFDNSQPSGGKRSLQDTASSILLSFGFLFTFFLTVSLALGLHGTIPFSTLSMYFIQLVAAAIQCFLERNRITSGLFKGILVLQTLGTLLITSISMQLTPLHICETLAVVMGMTLVTAGHWRRISHPEKAPHIASGMNFTGTGILVVVGLATLLAHRWNQTGDLSRWIHEIMALGLGVGLLQLGTFFKFRSTTIGGLVMLSTYILSLVMYLPVPKELENVSVLMMAIGGTVFGLAIFLSVYRDWVLTIPKKIKKGEGWLQFLNWKL